MSLSKSRIGAAKKQSITTVEKGNQFRDNIAALLRTCHNDVKTEQTLGGKTVDIVYTTRNLGKTETVGVECKDYERKLTAEIFTNKIIPGYRDLLESRLLDDVLIIGNSPIEKTVNARLQTVRGFSYLTHVELEENLLDFRSYIESLSELLEKDSLSSYYVESRFDRVPPGTSALEEIKTWISSKDSTPIAILGGYGQGKTTLAKRIITSQAKAYLEDPNERMPILIRLGEVVHETTLEGLFGREFTTQKYKTKYNFNTFRHLNEAGRFLIVLDGFDEMKAGMSPSDFISNFAEFKRLLNKNSKVILLGRPNAFSYDVRNYVLRGKKLIDGKETEDPTAVVWTEREISKFDKNETREFLTSYLVHLINSYQGKAKVLSNKEVPRRIEQILRDVKDEIIQRPVHAKIVAELAVFPQFSLKDFTEYKLYANFLTKIIERDAIQKQARRKISSEDRIKFQERLAYWAWSRTNANQGVFFRSDIPDRLYSDLPDGGAVGEEAKRNEYIVTTVTDEKEAGVLYFVHRSFQEFLVAEHLRKQRPVDLRHDSNSTHIDDSIYNFILGSQSQGFIDEWYETLPYNGNNLTTRYLSIFCTRRNVLEKIAKKIEEDRVSNLSPVNIAILGLVYLREDFDFFSKDKLHGYLSNCLVNALQAQAALAFHFLLIGVKDAEGAAQLLSMALEERLRTRLEVYRKQSSATKITLSDLVIDCAIGGIKLAKEARTRFIQWDIQNAYETINRLNRGEHGSQIRLEEGPKDARICDRHALVIRFTEDEFDGMHLPLTFESLVKIAGKEWDPRILNR